MNKNIKYSQNFLTSEKVLNQIIKQLNLKETDTVYDIGTGKGHLTTKLAKISKQVTSIELDSHLFNLSSEKLKLNNISAASQAFYGQEQGSATKSSITSIKWMGSSCPCVHSCARCRACWALVQISGTNAICRQLSGTRFWAAIPKAV